MLKAMPMPMPESAPVVATTGGKPGFVCDEPE
jgi:hypothetical protein